MTRWTPQFLTAALVLTSVGSVALARPPHVQDRARLYPPAVVQQADEVVAQIYDDYGINLLIETGSVPADSRFQSLIRQAWQRFFPHHTAGRSRSYRGDRTIYVRIAREPAPGVVEIEVGPDPQLQRGFPEAARAELRRLLLASLTKKDADVGLRGGVAYVSRTLTTNLGVPFDWGVAGTVLLGLLVTWLFLEALRAVCRARQTATDTGVASSSGAGGLGPALFALMIRGDFQHLFPPADAPARPQRVPVGEPLWHDELPPEEAAVAGRDAWAEHQHHDELGS